MSILRHQTALLPILVSLIIIALGIREAMTVGLHQPDEGTAAHVFQILMPLELVLITVFAFTWVPRSPRAALAVLALQVGLVVAIFAGVFFLT